MRKYSCILEEVGRGYGVKGCPSPSRADEQGEVKGEEKVCLLKLRMAI